jgi:hypothetical protein
MQRKDPDLIWITEAMVVYEHGRAWFKRRIDSGKLHTFPQPGETKVYLSRKEIEAEEAKENES